MRILSFDMALLLQGVDLNIRRECILKSLVIYLGEDVRHLIKEYLVSDNALRSGCFLTGE